MNISKDTFLLLTIANLEPKKGYIYLFGALSKLKKAGHKFRLLVVGSGREKKRLESEIKNKELQDEVALLGKRSDVARLLAASDAFILPSIWEGLPNALLEAMAAGLPVIATAVGGIPEVIADNKTGLLVEPKDCEGLAKAIERIMNEAGLCECLAQNAKDYAKKNFDIKNTVCELNKLYEELLRKRGKD